MLRNPFQRQPQGQQQAGQVIVRPAALRPLVQDAWVVQAENLFLHAVSLGFSGVSAFAIWQIFVSRHAGDIGRMSEGGVIATCFGIAGYFLSRNIAYRWMSGEMVIAYIPVCLVVELVEIYCNYVVGVSYLDLSDFFQTIPVSQHAFLLTAGRVVVSSIPAMTLFLSVAQMDLERRKLQPGPSGQPVRPGGTYAAGYQNQTQQQLQRQPQQQSQQQPQQQPQRRPLREQQAFQQFPAQQQNGATPPQQGVRANQ